MKGIVSIVLSHFTINNLAYSKFLLMLVTTWSFVKSSNTITSVSIKFDITPSIDIWPSFPSSRGIEVGKIIMNFIKLKSMNIFTQIKVK